jgi:hypothetical protein
VRDLTAEDTESTEGESSIDCIDFHRLQISESGKQESRISGIEGEGA